MTMYARVSSLTPKQLQSWRDRLGFSKYEAAYLLGVSFRSYAAYEKGETAVSKALALACWSIEELCIKDNDPEYEKVKELLDRAIKQL